jgi:hypothetical protein
MPDARSAGLCNNNAWNRASFTDDAEERTYSSGQQVDDYAARNVRLPCATTAGVFI